jgi:hypothetical protein
MQRLYIKMYVYICTYLSLAFQLLKSHAHPHAAYLSPYNSIASRAHVSSSDIDTSELTCYYAHPATCLLACPVLDECACLVVECRIVIHLLCKGILEALASNVDPSTPRGHIAYIQQPSIYYGWGSCPLAGGTLKCRQQPTQ